MSGKNIRVVYMKRYSFLFLFLFISIRANVQPITIGEGVWNVVTRIGSEIDLLDTSMISCDILIEASDLPYTISTSCRKYCLVESAEYTTNSSPAITIAASDVILDLQGRVIDGEVSEDSSAIVVSDGVNNVVVKNGSLKNFMAAGGGGDTCSGVVMEGIHKNIILENLFFRNFDGNAIRTDQYVDGYIIDQCRVYSAPRIIMYGSGIVRDCIINSLDENMFGQSSSNDPIPRFVVVENCLFPGPNTGSEGSGFRIDNGVHMRVNNCFVDGSEIGCRLENFIVADVRNCIIQNNQEGFVFRSDELAFQSLTVRDCSVCDVQGPAYYANPGFSVESASFLSGNVSFINCTAIDTQGDGFSVIGQIENAIFKNCNSTGGLQNGFAVIATDQNINMILFDGCIAQNNQADGFSFGTVYVYASLLDRIIVRNCIAQGNRGTGAYVDGDGFGFNSASYLYDGSLDRIIIRSCLAQNNADDGFDFDVTATNVLMLDCCSFDNGAVGINNDAGNLNFFLGNSALVNATDDIDGLTDPTKRPRYSFDGSLMGAGRWVNVRT